MDNLRICDLAESDRPREKLLQKGTAALSDAELLAIVIGSGCYGLSAVELSRRILSFTRNNIRELGRLDAASLSSSFKGIGTVKALTIIAALELGRRRAAADILPKKKIMSSNDIFQTFQFLLSDLPYEEFWMLSLSRSNKIIRKVKIGQGGVTETSADIKLILREAINDLASGLVLCHNHPSDNLHPSRQDDFLTERVRQAGKLLDISLLDHLIIGDNSYYSYADEGRL